MWLCFCHVWGTTDGGRRNEKGEMGGRQAAKPGRPQRLPSPCGATLGKWTNSLGLGLSHRLERTALPCSPHRPTGRNKIIAMKTLFGESNELHKIIHTTNCQYRGGYVLL